MDFTGKKVLVTGSTRGIGLATARAFQTAGADVMVHGTGQTSVDRAKKELGASHGVANDLATVDGCRHVDRCCRGHAWRVGHSDQQRRARRSRRLEDGDPARWDRLMNVNLRAPYFCSQFALPALRASKGNIVMVSSISGLMGHPDGDSVYCASKGGLVNMTRTLALELAPDMRVNCLAPGSIDTDMHGNAARESGDPEDYYRNIDAWVPLNHIGTAEEMANGILYLACDGAGYATGTILSLDGGVSAGH